MPSNSHCLKVATLYQSVSRRTSFHRRYSGHRQCRGTPGRVPLHTKPSLGKALSSLPGMYAVVLAPLDPMVMKDNTTYFA